MIQEKDRAEFIGQIIDVVEDFLDKKEPRGTEEAYIQGEWYDLLAGKLTDMMKNWDVLAEPEGPGDGEADATAECTLPPEDSDDVIILDSGNFTDAMACIRKNGFFDVDPDISLMVCKLFEKDGNLYRFDGWDHKDNCGSWQGIRMAPIRIMSSGRLEIPSAVLKRILV